MKPDWSLRFRKISPMDTPWANLVCGSLKMFPESLNFWDVQNSTIILSYIAFKIVPLCTYKFLPATVKVVGTFLEAIMWKHFRLFRRVLNDIINITIAQSFQCWFQLRDLVKIWWSQVSRIWRKLQCYHVVLCQEILARNGPASWSIVVKDRPTVGSPFSKNFFLTASLRRRKMSVNIS